MDDSEPSQFIIEATEADNDSDSVSSDSDEGSDGSNHSDSDDNEETMVIAFDQNQDDNEDNTRDSQQGNTAFNIILSFLTCEISGR